MRVLKHIMLLLFMGLSEAAMAQHKATVSNDTARVANAYEFDIQKLPEVRVNRMNRSRYWERYYRLVRKVKKVYPLARKARVVVSEYEQEYDKFNKKRERRRFAKGLEKALLEEYEPMIRKMSISEGRILIRLIDREVSLSSYHIIKEFRGGFTAFVWQSVAKLFRQDLKTKYDPYGEDYLLELIVQAIDRGEI
ncbi:DUF4294 domain-containing protein [Prolixibacteraceae bacterium]|nr:DUF4294 domain-containing protein [Prolixibacteraceae bacterium]